MTNHSQTWIPGFLPINHELRVDSGLKEQRIQRILRKTGMPPSRTQQQKVDRGKL